jgi:spermidine/putrescine transport system substrate-binding protein
MKHPKDKSGVTRRQLLRGAAAAAAGTGVVGALAACQNTTTPIGFCEDAGTEAGTGGDGTSGGNGSSSGGGGQGGGSGGGLSSSLVVAKPVGPGGLPLPRHDNSVEWAITDDNPMLADGVAPEGGTLSLFNYADYIDPGLVKKFGEQFDCEVEIGTYESADEAIAKLNSGAVPFDVVIGLSGSNIVQLMARQLLQPLNHTYLPNLANVWPELQDPFYDRGASYTVPYTVWQDGIGWRNDRIDVDIAAMDVPWDIFWQCDQWTGKVGILNDKRDALSMPMQRDAMRNGYVVDVNTEDPEVVAKAGEDLQELDALCNIKVRITSYQTLPEAGTLLHHTWSGDLLAGALYYMPSGTPPDVLSFWGPETGGVVQNDFIAISRAAERPALAHAFLNFMLDEQNAYDNMVNFNGYIPPQVGIDADRLVSDGLIPETLAGAVTRPEQFAGNQELLQLTIEGERLWDQAWSEFRGG